MSAENIKFCETCKQNAPAYKGKSAGQGPKVKRCILCRRQQMIDRIQPRREYVDAIKTASGCVDCGWNVDPCGLHFDHLENKTREIAAMVTGRYSLEDIDKEITKCEIVCANCHALRTKGRGFTGGPKGKYME